MTTYVLDASAVLRFTDKEAGFDRVRDLFVHAAQGKIALLLSAVNWGEIVGALYKRAGDLRSEEHTSELQSRRYLYSFPTRRSSDLSRPVCPRRPRQDRTSTERRQLGRNRRCFVQASW